jgi:hypothetical protein
MAFWSGNYTPLKDGLRNEGSSLRYPSYQQERNILLSKEKPCQEMKDLLPLAFPVE